MKLLGIDPSYTHTGLALIDTDKKVITFSVIGDPIGDKTFASMLNAVDNRVCRIKEFISSVMPLAGIISETPPPNGNFGAGLFGLDIHLLLSLKSLCVSSDIFGVTPTYLGHIHGKRRYTKTESVALAKRLLQEFTKEGFSVSVTGRISNDMAEAFLFVIRLYVFNVKDSISNRITKLIPNYNNKKEVLL